MADRPESQELTLIRLSDEWATRILSDGRIVGYVSQNLRHSLPFNSLSDHLWEWLDEYCHVSPTSEDNNGTGGGRRVIKETKTH